MAFNTGELSAGVDVVPEFRVLPAAAPGQSALFDGVIQHHFTGREHHQVLQRPLGPLGGRIEETDGLHLIPPELQPHRLGIERREQVDDPSPDAELAPFFHHRAALIPPLQEVLEKSRTLQAFSRHHVGQQVPDPVFRGQLLAQSHGRGHHEPGLPGSQSHGRRGQAGAAHVGVKAQFPKGQDLVGRKHEHPGPRASGPDFRFSQKKGQVLKYLFRKIDIGRDEENRAVDLLKEPGQDISPGPGGEALEMRLPGFPGEGRGQVLRSRAGE